MSWCTSSVGLQVLPFIDNRHLGGGGVFNASSYFLVTKLLLQTISLEYRYYKVMFNLLTYFIFKLLQKTLGRLFKNSGSDGQY